MSAYSELARMVHEAYQQGDDLRASLVARILEIVWRNEATDLCRTAPNYWRQIDAAMDGFTGLILQYARDQTERPNNNAEIAAYRAYQQVLDSLVTTVLRGQI